MSDFWVGQLFMVGCIVAFMTYWLWRSERRHKNRVADIDARAAADLAHFEARRRIWDEQDAKARAEYAARFAELRAAIPDEEPVAVTSSDPKLAAPGGV